MKKAVIYARFPSDMQREESIDAQVRACREHCIRKGYAVSNIYVDEAKSGRQIVNRDAYNRMMADATEHKFDVIVFHKLDRNARNEFTYYSFQHTLAQLGISYEYAAQPLDSSPEGRMMENVLVGMVAYYSRNLAKETKKGMNENAYKGLFNGGRPPFGYKIVDKKYIIDPHEADGVKLVFSMFLDGHGYAKIAHALAVRGYKTKDGHNFAKNSLYDILSNEKYIGNYIFNKTPRRDNRTRNTHSREISSDLIRVDGIIPLLFLKKYFTQCRTKRNLTVAVLLLIGQ